MVATPACHAPFTPAPQYKNNFNSSKAPRTAAFNVPGGPVSELFFEFSLFWYIWNPVKVFLEAKLAKFGLCLAVYFKRIKNGS